MFHFLSKLSNGVEILFGLVIFWKRAQLPLIGQQFVHLLRMEVWRLLTFIMKIKHIFLSFFATLLIATGLYLCSWKSRFLNQNTSLKWFIDPSLFDLKLSSFILLYLIILLGLLVEVLLLIYGMIHGVLLLLWQILQGYLMVLAFRIQSLTFGQVVIGNSFIFTADASFF